MKRFLGSAYKNILENIRRVSALAIALSLVLPQRSCVSGDQVAVHYPLSNVDSALSVALIASLYLLPLVVLLFARFRVTSLVLGIAAVAAGLYLFSYTSTLVATHLLIGWYTYTFGALAYLGASLVQLIARFKPNFAHKRSALP